MTARGFAIVAAAGAAMLGVVAACSSSSGNPGPSPSSALNGSFARFPTAASLLTQCAIDHGVRRVISSAEQYNKGVAAGQGWLTGTRVLLTSQNGSRFSDWYQNASLTAGGRPFGSWARTAASDDSLPPAVCGPGVSAGQLYEQVYAHWPGMLRHNPWSSTSTSTSSGPGPMAGSGAFDAQLDVALTSCFYQHYLIPARELKGLPVTNGRVYAPYRYHRGDVTGGVTFSVWFALHEKRITYRGKSMFDLELASSSHRSSWPASLCGPKPAPAPGTQVPGWPLYP